MNNKISIAILAGIFVMVIFSPIGNSKVFAGTAEQNYSVGHTDGCNDAQQGGNSAYYGHSNASHHSNDYNAGYDAGYAACKNSGQNVSNVDQNNRNQEQGQSLVKPFSNCFVFVGTCQNQNQQGEQLSN